jgi:hypothetical protein
MNHGFESNSSSPSQSILETEAKQRAARTAVQRLSRMAGDSLPITAIEGYEFPQEPGVYLFDHEVVAPGEITNVDFVMDPRRSSGAADSAHAVISGDLEVDFENGNKKEIEIGAKCYQKRTLPDRLQRAANEVQFTHEMQEAGLLAMVPVGVAIGTPETGSDVVLLTRWDDNLLTFDNNPWSRGLTVGNMTDALTAAGAVGEFNRSGRVHRDAKIKNVATSNATGQVGMIDFETSRHFDSQDPIEAAAAASTDLGLLLKSLGDKGFFNVHTSGFTPNTDQIVNGIREICETGYLSKWEQATPDVQSAVYDAVVNVAEREIEERLAGFRQLATV